MGYTHRTHVEEKYTCGCMQDGFVGNNWAEDVHRLGVRVLAWFEWDGIG